MRLTASQLVPSYVRRLLRLGPATPEVCRITETGPERIWFMQGDDPQLNGDIVAQGVDCLVLVQSVWQPERLQACLDHLHGVLNPDGRLVVLLNNSGTCPDDDRVWDELFSKYRLQRYHSGTLIGDSGAVWGIIAVRHHYDPLVHARQCTEQGRPDWAVEILDHIPENRIKDKDTLIRITLEKQRAYLLWQKTIGGQANHHANFSKERRMFAKVMALDPRQTESYRIHADFWTHIGRDDMALRLLRAVEQVCPDPENRRMLSLLEDRPSRPPQSSATEQNNVWHGQWPAPRILVLCHNYSDYGMDTLYHGLCTLLGKENVVEYPWKPTLHGQDIHSAMGYPCVFDFGADALSEDQIEEQLRQGRFDLIIFADLVKFRHQPVVRRFMRAAPQVPIVVCDTWDDCYTPMERVVEYLGTDRIALVFKREMLSGVEYGPDTYPLPFSYPESYTEGAQNSDRGNPVFWAGKREYGLRHLYMDRLSAILGQDLDRRYDQDQYRKMLRASRIGISFSGCGFDTVRYWELPANGVMLMAERPPIEIPYNFEDGVSAVFFDDPADMAVKLRHYMARPDEVSRIAAAGHAHYLKHHTTVARARQFLGMVAHQMPQWLERLSHKAATDREGRAAALHTGRPIHLGLVKGENYGWGVCSRYFIEGLSGLRNIHVLNSEDGSDQNPGLDGVLFQALTNHHFDCMFPGARADINIGYTFFENELSERSVANAARYDSVLGGSTWCRDRMVEKGIANCDVLIQGIDPKVFHPIEQATRDDRFVIFSGGKFELRKGQDLVLRAVKIMQEKYPDVWLVNCWYNLWPSSTQLMTYSQHIRFEHHENEPWLETMGRTYAQNGLDADRIITHELVPQARQRELFARTDIGLFANRCEGGTNLVLMEYMACAKPVVASNNTGHKDIVNDDNALLLKHQAPYNILDANGNLFGRWHESSLDEIVAQLEYAYHHRDELQRIGRQAGEDLKRFTWDDSTRQLLQFLES